MDKPSNSIYILYLLLVDHHSRDNRVWSFLLGKIVPIISNFLFSIDKWTSKPVFLGSNKQDLSFTEQQKMLLPDKKPWAFWAVSYVWYTFSFCQMFVWNMERKNLLIQERQLDLHAPMLTQNLHHPSSSMPCIVLGYIIKQLIKNSTCFLSVTCYVNV